jgi:type I restriction enzyme S subunit
VSDSFSVGWPTALLDSLLADVQPGFASGKHNSSGKGVPHFRPMNVSTSGRIDRSVLKYVDPSAGRPELRLRPGDVVFNNTNSPELVGKTALFEDDDAPAFSNHMTRLRVDASRLDPGFLALRLHQAWREGWFAAHCNNHVSQASVGRDVLRAFEIELPPLEIQRAIHVVSQAIDERRTSSAGHLARARRLVGRFRQAVLAAACSGRLTAEWRSSIGRESNSDQPAGWSEATVVSLAADVPRAIQSGPFGSNLKHSEFQPTGRLVIGIDNVLDGQFVLGSQHRISEVKYAELKKYEARPLDVLITVMATVGRVCVVPSDIEPSIITKHVYRITVDQERVLPFFLMHALRGHPKVRAQIHTQTRGQTRPGINGQIVKGLVIAVPPVDEQREIVTKVDRLLALADRVLARVEDASSQVDRSSQAVLAKAFRGDLITSSVGEASNDLE